MTWSFIAVSWGDVGGKAANGEGQKGSGDELARLGRCKEGARRVHGWCEDGARRVQGGCKDGARMVQGDLEYGSKGILRWSRALSGDLCLSDL